MKLHQDMSDVVGFEIWSRKESATYKDTGFASSYSEYPFNAEWHEDVDEDLRHQEGKLRHPLISSIYYLDVDISEGGKIYKTPKINSIIYFEVSNANNVQASINTYPINRYLKSQKNNNKGKVNSIKGLYNPKNNIIEIKYYQN